MCVEIQNTAFHATRGSLSCLLAKTPKSELVINEKFN